MKMSQADREKEREQLVTKSNELIQFGRYDLSVAEQKVIMYLISKIKPSDTDLHTYDFYIPDFCEVCGINKSGNNYIALKEVITKLLMKKWWIPKTDTAIVSVGWLGEVVMDSGSGVVQIQLDRNLKPYLLELKHNFTSYELSNCLCFKSRYSLPIYEFICSVHYAKMAKFTWTFDTLESFREQFCIEGYAVWRDLKKRVIDIAEREINLYTDREIHFIPIRTGKSVTGINIEVKRKSEDQIWNNRIQTYKELDGVNYKEE